MIDVPPSASPSVARAITTARNLIAGATSENTRRGYETGWRQFTARAQSLGLRATRGASGAHCDLPGAPARWRGVGPDHGLTGGGDPVLPPGSRTGATDLLEGARRADAGRDHGRANITAKRLAAALTLQGPPATPLAVRDRAIVLLTFASGRRRTEIAGLNIEDLDFSRSGFLIVTIRKSKTDQSEAGQFVAVPRLDAGPCAVAARSLAGHPREKKGVLFVAFSPHGWQRENRIAGRLVAEVAKRLFRDAGAHDIDAIAAHSLRRGFITSADMAGATTAQIMDVTGHRDPKSLRRYTRRELLHDPVLPKLFGP